MPKDEAIAFFEELVDENTRRTLKDKKEKVAELLFRDAPMSKTFEKGFCYVEFELDEGQAGCKITKCKHCESLREVNDPDYAYAVACHYDFEAGKVNNPAFRLTRTGTLAQGKPYCDFIWHDTRIHKDITHPPKEFWEQLK